MGSDSPSVLFVARERTAGESRVAVTPDAAKALVGMGFEVCVESGAGASAHFDNEAYVAAGAVVAEAADARSALERADVVVKVGPPADNPDLGMHEAQAIKPGALVVGMLAPHRHVPVVRTLQSRGVNALAMELIPRISRAQSMDALSSQASIAGYKAVILAALHLPRYFPNLMTAAGTIPPARVVVMGAGVAGLQAVATARRLGAVVEVSDVRAEVKEQVESLGAKFIPLPALQRADGQSQTGGYAQEVTAAFLQEQRAIVAERIKKADVVITTALVPGRPAPKLVTEAMVQSMRRGGVIVDLATEAGGNCEVSEPGRDVVRHGVLVMGPTHITSLAATDASVLYARNLVSLLQLVKTPQGIVLPLQDEIIAGALLIHQGEIRHAPTRALVEQEPQGEPS